MKPITNMGLLAQLEEIGESGYVVFVHFSRLESTHLNWLQSLVVKFNLYNKNFRRVIDDIKTLTFSPQILYDAIYNQKGKNYYVSVLVIS